MAYLRFRSIMDRAKALISAAYHDFRDELKFEANKKNDYKLPLLILRI